uniref:HDC12017 n=1 Tax=Drosophila melanogaster TaxID=7227 RepID=Q6IKN8_DROME|nr:TPA_inf: HDC12017 [Drosophila melanogaster]
MAKGANCLLVCGHVCVNLSVDMTMQLQNAGVEQHFNVLPASARVPECHSFPVPGPGPGSRPVPVPAPLPLPAANYFCGLPTTLSVLLFPSLSEHPHYPDSLLFDPLCTRPPLGIKLHKAANWRSLFVRSGSGLLPVDSHASALWHFGTLVAWPLPFDQVLGDSCA